MDTNVDHLTRQLSLIPMATLNKPITIIGCGAIGSFAVLALAKMGLTDITVYDYDTVSIENMSNQGFRFRDIGVPKVHALTDIVQDFSLTKLKAVNRLFTAEDISTTKGILITAVDSMAARRMIRDALTTRMHYVTHVIDPRMGAEVYAQYAYGINTDNKWYDNTITDDSVTVQENCTAKSTVYTATLAAGMITKTVKNILLNETYPNTVDWNIKLSNQYCFNLGTF